SFDLSTSITSFFLYVSPRFSSRDASLLFCFFNDPSTSGIYTLSLHDALPIFSQYLRESTCIASTRVLGVSHRLCPPRLGIARGRSEEHTSELQSRFDLVCRLLLEKKNLQVGCSHSEH